MWMLVMFDLPVDTPESRKAATDFRHFLLDHGFEMSQLSIYARFCNGKEQVETHISRVARCLPPRGEIHVVTITDRQYENIVRFSGRSRTRPRKNPDQLALF